MDISSIKIGFVGYGNMGQAMATGWVNNGKVNPNEISACARNFEKLENNTKKIGIHPYKTAEEVVNHSDIIVLAVKPYQITEVAGPIKENLQDKIVLSIAANYTYKMYEKVLLKGTSHVSTIPNTPVSIGEGIIILEDEHSLSGEEEKIIIELLSLLGIVQVVPTEQLSVAGTLAGCGPAFASMFIEALADGAVKYGLSRKDAYRLASQMIAGTGKMQLETDTHPGVMKDAVCSPGGTTIKGVSALEKNGFRGAIIEAFDAIEGK